MLVLHVVDHADRDACGSEGDEEEEDVGDQCHEASLPVYCTTVHTTRMGQSFRQEIPLLYATKQVTPGLG